jgi:hypothetical protein
MLQVLRGSTIPDLTGAVPEPVIADEIFSCIMQLQAMLKPNICSAERPLLQKDLSSSIVFVSALNSGLLSGPWVNATLLSLLLK